ncbi:unnamed protein product [Rotaria socialis]|uniref:Uncharacterized protein n=1 Tax=Rotaria socialis TaxID=392032 RepID=A0A820PA13_9BILA|nr:unnamed protein product [Rotaria socialis]CAF4549869.1 unnamed protein product [Rotaria socialis]CAF4729089.1 unnamed protein product [Rotaria socialis]CAF4969254.1 unnamed protein product [Rotaria socialis]
MGTYLRVLISPSILLNTLCIFVLARSRLSNKSITVVFLRFLAVFDILAITLKFIRAEINYQSIVKMRDVSFMTPFFCKTLYLTQKRACYICYLAVIILALANSPFIKLADVGPANNQRVFCGLIKYSLIIDITTASILPIGGKGVKEREKKVIHTIISSLEGILPTCYNKQYDNPIWLKSMR